MPGLPQAPFNPNVWVEHDGDVEAAPARGAETVTVVYEVPYLARAAKKAIGPVGRARESHDSEG